MARPKRSWAEKEANHTIRKIVELDRRTPRVFTPDAPGNQPASKKQLKEIDRLRAKCSAETRTWIDDGMRMYLEKVRALGMTKNMAARYIDMLSLALGYVQDHVSRKSRVLDRRRRESVFRAGKKAELQRHFPASMEPARAKASPFAPSVDDEVEYKSLIVTVTATKPGFVKVRGAFSGWVSASEVEPA
jgi:hypothetical protein